jgi:hypothetical protein
LFEEPNHSDFFSHRHGKIFLSQFAKKKTTVKLENFMRAKKIEETNEPRGLGDVELFKGFFCDFPQTR